MLQAAMWVIALLNICNNRVKTYSPVISGVIARRLTSELSRRAVRPGTVYLTSKVARVSLLVTGEQSLGRGASTVSN